MALNTAAEMVLASLLSPGSTIKTRAWTELARRIEIRMKAATGLIVLVYALLPIKPNAVNQQGLWQKDIKY